ncbi:MAG: NUDIX domain-containing protein [Pseudomonadota bacterium]
MPTFLYGTLRDDILRTRLIGRHVFGTAAQILDHHVKAHVDAPIPALVAEIGTKADGILVRDLTDDETARLDAYENAFDYEVRLLPVIADDHTVKARVYCPKDTVEIGEELWDLAAWQNLLGPLSRERAIEIGEADPPYDAATLRRRWAMIGSRAAARLRAAADTTPSEIRHTARSGDFEVLSRRPLVGDFFKFRGFDLRHRTFQETVSPNLQREVMVGVDAAIVLPYDPVSDCVLLVEQIRTGPLMRGAPNPWALEPVAGMVDPHETPAEAALRETAEEAGLDKINLEKMFECYASPGASTDYFYCYVAIGSLPEPSSYTGGLAEENEDLRLHILPFDQALNLIETGEANISPLISMLLWLARHRDRLREAA